MIRKLIVAFVVGFVILTVVVAVLSARKGDQRRPSPPATQTKKDAESRHIAAQVPRAVTHEQLRHPVPELHCAVC